MKKGCLLGLAVVLLFSVGCHNERPSTVLSQNEMEDVLYDYHLALAMAQFSKDSIDWYTHVYAEAALRKYGITKADLDSSLVWYAEYTRDLYDIYKNVQARMDREMLMLGRETSQTDFFSSLSSEGDTANVWKGRNFYLLSSNNMSNRMVFSIDADSTYLPEDTYLWHFVTRFVFSEGMRQAIVNLQIRYENDSVSVVSTTVGRDGEFQVEAFAADKKIKRVEGFVYLATSWSKDEKKLIIMQPALVRYHNPKRKEEISDSVQTAVTDSVAVDKLRMDSTKHDTVFMIE